MLGALAAPTRRAIFEQLCHKSDKSVAALKERDKVFQQAAVSKHLAALKRAGLVRERDGGRQSHYSAQLKSLVLLIEWTRVMAGFWEATFNALEELLKKMGQ